MTHLERIKEIYTEAGIVFKEEVRQIRVMGERGILLYWDGVTVETEITVENKDSDPSNETVMIFDLSGKLVRVVGVQGYY